MAYKIETAAADDAFGIFNLAYACLTEAGFSPLSGGAGKEINPNAIERACRSGRVRIIRECGEAVAAITLTEKGAENLFVSPSYRGRGMGGALLEAAEKELAAAGCEEFTLVTRLPDGFYRRRGYFLVRRKKVLQGDTVAAVTEERKKSLLPVFGGYDAAGEPCGEGKYGLECRVAVRRRDGEYLLMKRAAGRRYAGAYECTAGGGAKPGERAEDCAARILRESTGLTGELFLLGREVTEDTVEMQYLFIADCGRGDILLPRGKYTAFRWTARQNVLRSKTPLLTRVRKYLLLRGGVYSGNGGQGRKNLRGLIR